MATENKTDPPERFLQVRERRMIRDMLHPVTDPVLLRLFLDQGDTPAQTATGRILHELTEAAPKRIRLKIHRAGEAERLRRSLGIQYTPTLVPMKGGGTDCGIRYAGIPSGYQLGVLIALLVDLAQDQPHGSAKIRALCGRLDTRMKMTVFLTPSCPHSARVVRLAQRLTLVNPLRLTLTAIDVLSLPYFPDIQEVPQMVMEAKGRSVRLVGTVTEASWAAAVSELLDGRVVR